MIEREGEYPTPLKYSVCVILLLITVTVHHAETMQLVLTKQKDLCVNALSSLLHGELHKNETAPCDAKPCLKLVL